MAEGQVSIEGRTHAMDELFFVIATQNPVEFRGTYPLPEAQMDRFAMCLALGYVDADTEVAVLAAQELEPPARAAARGGDARGAARAEGRGAPRAHVRRAASTTSWSSCAARAPRRRCCSAAGRAPRSRSRSTAKALALFDGEEFVRPGARAGARRAGARAPHGARPAGALRRRERARRSSPTSCARCRSRLEAAHLSSRCARSARCDHWLRERLTSAGLARPRRRGGRRGGRHRHRPAR